MNVNNFAIMKFKEKDLLCVVQDSYFASSAWLLGQESFKKISGESFGIVTGDDGLEYKESKYKFRLPTEQEVLDLFPTCCDKFKTKYSKLL